MCDLNQVYDTANQAHSTASLRRSFLHQVQAMLAKIGDIAGSKDLDDEDRSIVLGVVDQTGEHVLLMHLADVTAEERRRWTIVEAAARAVGAPA